MLLRQLFLLIASLFFLSPMGANKILVFGGNNYFEPFLFVYLLVLFGIYKGFRGFFVDVLRSYVLKVALLGCIFLSVLGYFFNSTSFVESYAIARSFLVFLVVFCAVRLALVRDVDFKNVFFEIIFWLSLYTLASSVIYFYFFSTAQSVKQAYSITAIVTACFLVIYRKGYALQMFVFLFVLFAAFTSSYRAYIAYSLLMVSACFFKLAADVVVIDKHGFSINSRSAKSLLLYTTIAIFLGPFLYNLFTDWVMADSSRYHQLIYKMESQIDAFYYGASDYEVDERILMYSFLFDNILGFLLPSGFFDRQYYEMTSPWISEIIYFPNSSPVRDGGFFFFVLTFGVLVTIALMLWFLFKFATVIKNDQPKDIIIKVATFLVVVPLFFSMGNIFLVVDVAFYYGVLLAILSTKTKTVSFA